ncbi:MAG: CDP-glycerol glycerophosphotransferase family protein [Bacteroides sp.]|nr:CDP-glycerol glycerophosphotransferase family protein [Bacteroides sp.]MCM1378597.1 CDP-glycerol glycerophosphotransferase family protein [Bacteroides sp.]MCM1444898.1 CDP-glycerol glycerophosphotransferase family protein [Prevotella sp.]
MSKKEENHLIRNLRRAPGSAALKMKKWYYRHIFMPAKLRSVRKKERIRVVFVVANLSCWKTESLYQAMLANKRFEPILLVLGFIGKPDFENIETYFRTKGYDYKKISDEQTICSALHPDIIFYQQPYEDILPVKHMYYNNMGALFCYVSYSMRSTLNILNTNIKFNRICWQVYYENELNLTTYSNINPKYTAAGLVTGLPVMDDLIQPSENFPDPWKPSPGKKRIIYAPHHSIDNDPLFHTATFLETGPVMLEMAEKYADRVQWAFKPHPFLRVKLEKVWGKEATDEYFNRWANVEWSQYESGEYMGLFKHSDAMIHDCGSFTIEYLYTEKPVMYLTLDHKLPQEYNEMNLRALDVHYQGNTREAIEQFICDVLAGNDPKRYEREAYRRNYLVPPGNTSACQNIITAILGK